MKQYLTFLLIVEFFSTISCQCYLTARQVQNETRVVGIARKGQLQILNEDKIHPGETIYFICNDSNVVEVTCRRNNKFSRRLPIQNCANPPNAVVEETFDDACQFRAYRVGYKVRNGFWELYRSCFNAQRLSTVFTSHDVEPKSLFTKRPDTTFTTDGVMTLKNAASYQTKNIFKRFEALLGPNQPYARSRNDLIIDRGHLAPSADFLFPVNMRATFKYVNVIPQFSGINRGNWKSIEEFVRNYTRITGSARITTGAFDILTLPDINGNPVEMFLEDGNRNPIPKWIYKIINSPHGSVVFLTYNNVFDQRKPVPVCEDIGCPIRLKQLIESGLTYCCDPNDFVRNVLPRFH